MTKHSAANRAVSSPRFKFSVYIAGQTRQSELALARLRKICDKEIPANYVIEIIDLAKNPHLAKEHQIVATPSIFRTLPAPIRKSIGNLSKADKTLLGLDLWNGKIALRGTDQSKGTGE